MNVEKIVDRSGRPVGPLKGHIRIVSIKTLVVTTLSQAISGILAEIVILFGFIIPEKTPVLEQLTSSAGDLLSKLAS